MKFCLYLFVFCLSAHCGVETVEHTIPLDSGWQMPPEAKVIRRDGESILNVTVAPGVEKGRMVAARRKINLSHYHGHQIELVYEARAINISKPGDPWNGMKLMLYYRAGEFKHWPNAPRELLTGSYDWKTITIPLYIPMDVADGEFNLGLQDSSGTVEIRSLVIRDHGFKNPYPAPASIPAGFKAEYTSRVTGMPQLRGVMSPPVYRRGDLDDLASWNANIIRWQIGHNWGKEGADRDISEYRKWLNGKLDELELVFADCERLGIQVVIDVHSPPGGRRSDQALTMLYDRKYADEFIRTWREIAARFKGRKALWAYDLINEPIQIGMAEVDYLTLQYQTALEIRKIDPDTPIIVTSNNGSDTVAFSYMQPLPLKDIIYQVHMYLPGAFTHQKIGNTAGVKGGKDTVSYPGNISNEKWDRDTMKKYFMHVRGFQLKYDARIYCGEFSAVRYAPGAAKYLEDLISIFEEYGWDWSYHSFRESPYWSVEYPDDPDIQEPPSTPTDRMKVLLRAFEKNKKLK